MGDRPQTDNYGARDERIRCQTYTPVRRLDGLPHELFAAYWRDVHGPLASRQPGLGYYVQHHFSRDRFASLWPLPDGTKRMDLVLDGAVELGFATERDSERFAAAGPLLFGDEFNLFAHVVAYNLPQGSRTLVDRQVDGIPNGRDPLHRLHLHLNGGSEKTFKRWVLEWTTQLAESTAVQKLRLHLPEPYDNAYPSPPSPFVNHRLSDERKDIAVVEIGFSSAMTARRFFESREFKATTHDQSRHLLSLGVFLVTGVYTFVRDGALTTAGFRGSRVAELIEQIGATNQTQDEVARRFVANTELA